VCQPPILDSKELILLTIIHAIAMTEIEGEMKVEIGKGHFAYWKIKSLLDLWFWIFSSSSKASPLDSSSQVANLTYCLDEASNSQKYPSF
jgi:hypothetical protein